jgi:ferredoxin-NADP reductase
MDVVVEEVRIEAVDVISVGLRRSDGTPFPAWEPGAHIDFHLAPDLERQYSLCSDHQDRGLWRVGVLREPESRGGSEWVHTKLSAGDALRIAGPRNNFPLVSSDRYLLIAGGIGVTPLLAMARELDRRGAEWSMLYGGRQAASMAFTEELSAFGDRVDFKPQDVHGLLDLDGFLGGPTAGMAVYCCGPERLLNAVEERCAAWPPGTLHVERFHPRPGALDGENSAFEVMLEGMGIALTVAADQTIVEALDAAGIDWPTSCREGTCGTCETRVLEGIPDHRDSFLMDEEKADNATMMICCSRALTPQIVLDI